MKNKSTSLKKQVGGNWYKEMGIQPWEIIDANGLNFYEGCVLKYLLRHKKKGGVQDLKKAIHFLEHLIEKESYPQSISKNKSTK